jgi:hypothetical protein
MSDPNLVVVQDPYIWFVSANLDPTADEPVVDDSMIDTDPNWFSPWWNRATDNVFLCTNNTPASLVWKRFVLFDTNRTYSSVSLSFGTARIPNANKETIVIASIRMVNTLLTTSTIEIQVDNAGNGTFATIATLGMSGVAATNTQSVTFNVPVRSQYQIIQSGSGTNTIISINELPL